MSCAGLLLWFSPPIIRFHRETQRKLDVFELSRNSSINKFTNLHALKPSPLVRTLSLRTNLSYCLFDERIHVLLRQAKLPRSSPNWLKRFLKRLCGLFLHTHYPQRLSRQSLYRFSSFFHFAVGSWLKSKAENSPSP